MALTAALLHSPSTHNRAEGVRGRRFRLKISKMEFQTSGGHVMKRCKRKDIPSARVPYFRIIEGLKAKGTFESRRRCRHAIARRRSSRIERLNGSRDGRIPSKIAAPSSSPASPSLIVEETVYQIARLVAAVVWGIPFYNVERVEYQEPSG